MANKYCCGNFKGWSAGCVPPPGGINKIWVACFNDVTAPTVSPTTGVISAFTQNPATGDPIWKEYNVQVDTASLTGTGEENGYGMLIGQAYDIGIVFPGVDAVTVLEANSLRNSAVAVIIEDANGNARYFGNKMPFYMRDTNDNTGTARADNNEITFVLRGTEPDFAHFIDPTVWATFKSPASTPTT